MTAQAEEPLWTIEDVSAYLRIPVPTLYAWRRQRKGPTGVRLGKHLRYAPEEVRQWWDRLRKAA